MRWRKSTHSNPNGACIEVASGWRTASGCTSRECVEIGQDWRTASYSFSNGNCVEVASGIGVRDTKQEHLGDARTVLGFSSPAWAEFTSRVKAGWQPRSR